MPDVAAFWIDVPERLVDQLVEEGLIANCLVHGVWEVAAGHASKELEDRLDLLDEMTPDPEACPVCGHDLLDRHDSRAQDGDCFDCKPDGPCFRPTEPWPTRPLFSPAVEAGLLSLLRGRILPPVSVGDCE